MSDNSCAKEATCMRGNVFWEKKYEKEWSVFIEVHLEQPFLSAH